MDFIIYEAFQWLVMFIHSEGISSSVTQLRSREVFIESFKGRENQLTLNSVSLRGKKKRIKPETLLHNKHSVGAKLHEHFPSQLLSVLVCWMKSGRAQFTTAWEKQSGDVYFSYSAWLANRASACLPLPP